MIASLLRSPSTNARWRDSGVRGCIPAIVRSRVVFIPGIGCVGDDGIARGVDDWRIVAMTATETPWPVKLEMADGLRSNRVALASLASVIRVFSTGSDMPVATKRMMSAFVSVDTWATAE